MDTPRQVRLDKWLWAVRIYKTRSLATAACQAGHVRVNGHSVKPAHHVRPGEVITARAGEILRTLRVVGLPEQRVGAGIVPSFAEDLTPPEEYAKPREPRLAPTFLRPRGTGRPTKKNRRDLERLGW